MYLDMRIFRVVTGPAWSAHGKRAKFATTPALGLAWSTSDATGSLQHLLRKIVATSLFNSESLSYIGFGKNLPFSTQVIAERVFDLVCGFMFDRVQSAVLSSDSHPQASAPCLSDDPAMINDAPKLLAEEWATLQWCESVAPFSPDMKAILDKIPWVKHAVPRLIFTIAQARGPNCRHLTPCGSSVMSTCSSRIPRLLRTCTSTSGIGAGASGTRRSCGLPACMHASGAAPSRAGAWIRSISPSMLCETPLAPSGKNLRPICGIASAPCRRIGPP